MFNGFYIMINYNLHTNRDKQGLGHRVYLAGDLHSKVSVRAGGREEGGAHPAGPACPHSNRFLQGCNSLCQPGANICQGLANRPTLIPVPCE